jgi:uncharacterized damage-inducible protein DinB
MNKEVQSIIRTLENVLNGQPWYGKPVYKILEEVDPVRVSVKPNQSGHSLLELLYHMNTWAEFTLQSLQGQKITGMSDFEKDDWRIIDPSRHTWEKGLADFKTTHEKIISQLSEKEDEFLKQIVDHRGYNFRFLLNGLIQHNIYHLGQIAYINKFLA